MFDLNGNFPLGFIWLVEKLLPRRKREEVDWKQNWRCELLTVKTIYVKINMTAAPTLRERCVMRESRERDFQGDAANMAKLHEKCACRLLRR